MSDTASIGRRWADGNSAFLPHEVLVIRAYVHYMATDPVRQPALLNSLAEVCELAGPPSGPNRDHVDGVLVTLRSLDLDPLAAYRFHPNGRMLRAS
jgi:hypothetical protein